MGGWAGPPDRTVVVLGVVYLLCTEDYAATTGVDLVREGLCGEAIRLGRLLAELMPDEPGVGPVGPDAVPPRSPGVSG